MRWLRDIGELAVCPRDGGPGEIGRIERAAIAWDENGDVVWVGREADAPSWLNPQNALSAHGASAIPGLIDSHTHLAFAGWRADEFERILTGATYQEIAAQGGGIQRTVRLTREASQEELTERGLGFLREMAALGVTTVEAKTGYGLAIEQERKLLTVYRRIAERSPLTLVSTLLAHIVPPERRADREPYIKEFCEDLIPWAASEGLARFCDVFVEEGAFSVAEGRRILQAGLNHGLGAKVHADQLSDCGGALLAAELGAASADHLERVSDAGLDAMAEKNVVATVLPIAALYLRQPALDARRCVERGVRVAVATDFNERGGLATAARFGIRSNTRAPRFPPPSNEGADAAPEFPRAHRARSPDGSRAGGCRGAGETSSWAAG